MKNFTVQIFNEQYTLVSDEAEERILCAVQLLDQYMGEIKLNARINDPKKIAVLAALRLSSILLDLQEHVDACNQEKAALVEYLDKELQI